MTAQPGCLQLEVVRPHAIGDQVLLDLPRHLEHGPLHRPGPIGVELVDGSRRRVGVAGNPVSLAPVGDLPESQRLPGEAGTLEITLKWFNWCGQGSARLRWIGEPASGGTVGIRPPRCTDASKPSRLSVERVRR